MNYVYADSAYAVCFIADGNAEWDMSYLQAQSLQVELVVSRGEHSDGSVQIRTEPENTENRIILKK